MNDKKRARSDAACLEMKVNVEWARVVEEYSNEVKDFRREITTVNVFCQAHGLRRAATLLNIAAAKCGVTVLMDATSDKETGK